MKDTDPVPDPDLVDRYLAERLLPADPVLDAAMDAADAAGLPRHGVSALQGRFLEILARIRGARRILEIGTLAGYSTICLARALPQDGQLVTLEAEPRHAEVARQNIARAGLSSKVDLRLGRALETLPDLVPAFDFVFIDADKPNNPAYLEWALRLSAPGTVIVIDNVVREGAVIDADSPDLSVQGVRALFEMIDSRVEASAIQTVGGKGWDGFAILRVSDG